MASRPPSLLFAGAWLLGGFALWRSGAKWLGAGSVAQGVQELLGYRDRAPQPKVLGAGGGLGESLSEAAARVSGGAKTKSTKRYVKNIDERVAIIRDLTRKSSQEPTVRDRAHAILNRKCGTPGNEHWCVTEKNSEEEIRAIFWAFKDPKSPFGIRYTRDHVAIDQFSTAEKILKNRAADCDEAVVVLGAHLMAIGMPVKLRVIRTKDSREFNHIYLLVGLGPTGTPKRWKPLDLTVNKTPGWEPPPSMVAAVKDYDVPLL